MNFFRNMLKCKEEIYNKKDRLSADAYLKVKKFVEGGEYSKVKKAGSMAKLILSGYSNDYIANHFEISSNTVRVEKNQMSVELYRIFPADFFAKLVNYRENREFVDDCLYSLRTYNLKSSDFVLSDVLMSVRFFEESSEDYDLVDLSNEIDFLLRYSKLFLDKELEDIDKFKLKFLVEIIDGKKGNPSLRSKVIKELNKGCYD